MSDGVPGNLMLLKIGGVVAAGMRTTAFKVNLDPIDVTNKTSAGWQTLLEGGKKRVVIEADLVAMNDTTVNLLRDSAYTGARFDGVISNFDGDIVSGTFRVGMFQQGGSYKDAELVKLTLHSTTAAYAGSAPVPATNRLLWLATGGTNQQYVIVDLATGAYARRTDCPIANARYVMTPSRVYAFSYAGRYVCWTDDFGLTWSAISDYGANLKDTVVIATYALRDGVPNMLIGGYANGNKYWATIATPPVLTGPTLPGTMNSYASGVQYWQGEPLLAGEDSNNTGMVCRYVGGTWEKVSPRVGFSGTTNSICKAADGRYFAISHYFTGAVQVTTAATFNGTWSVAASFTGAQSGQGLLVAQSGRVVFSISRSGNPYYVQYSDNSGASWSNSVLQSPVQTLSSLYLDDSTGYEYGIGSPNCLMRSVDGGANWSIFAVVDDSYEIVGAFTSSYSIAGVDPTAWVGAWDLATSGRPNAIAAAPFNAYSLTQLDRIQSYDKAAPWNAAGYIYNDDNTKFCTASTMDWSAQLTVGDFTVACMQRGDAAGAYLRAFSTKYTADYKIEFGFGTAPSLTVNNTAYGGVSHASTDYTWHHYAMVRSGSVVTVYKDGVVVRVISTTSALLTIGTFSAVCGTGGTKCEMKKVIFTRQALPQAQIALLAAGAFPTSSGSMGPVPALADPSKWIGAWDFAGGAVTNIVTAGTGGDFNDGNGQTLVPVASSNGYQNGYCIGQGSDPGYVVARGCANPSAATFDINQGFTFAGWINYAMTPFGTEEWIHIGGVFTSFDISFGHGAGTVYPFKVNGSDAGTATSGQVWPGATSGLQRFVAVVVSRSGSNLIAKRYINGSLISTDTLPLVTTGGGVVPAKMWLYLYTFYSNAALWLDNVIFTKEALSDEAVAALATGRMPSSSGVL